MLLKKIEEIFFPVSATQVNWNPVIWGLAIQFALGLFILRTKVGFYVFNFMGDFTRTFMSYVAAGCIFVFGDTYEDHFFAFVVSM